MGYFTLDHQHQEMKVYVGQIIYELLAEKLEVKSCKYCFNGYEFSKSRLVFKTKQ